MKDSFNQIFTDVNRVLVVLAHPDDAEVSAGGTIARLIKEGKNVRMLCLTNGGKGMRDMDGYDEKKLAKERRQEMVNGAKELGVSKENIICLEIPDGQIELTYENIGVIVEQIRIFKPDLVITHNPVDMIIEFSKTSQWVNHRDHRHTGQLVLDAAYPYSRDKGFFPEQLEKGLKIHSVYKLLFTDAYMFKDSVSINMTSENDQKVKALQAHVSQLSKENAIEYSEECKVGDEYFEKFRYLEVY